MDELTKTFFDTFGIEPKNRFKGCKLGVKYYSEICDEPTCDGCDDEIRETEYPQITDRILLELICILADLYDSNSHGYPLFSKDIKELKEDVLDDLMGAIDVANDYPEGYVNKVRTLFKEG